MIKQIITAFIVIVVSILIFSCGDSEKGPTPEVKYKNNTGKEYLKLKVVKVIDYSGFEKPEAAYTLLLPSDWKVSGGISWHNGNSCLTDYITNHLLAESPDGKLSFEIFPIKTWNWITDPQMLQMAEYTRQTTGQGCPFSQPLNASQFITQMFIPAWRRGASVVKIDHVNSAANAAEEKSSEQVKSMLQANNIDLKTDAVIATLNYPSDSGTKDEMVTAGITQYAYQLPSPSGSYYTYYTTSAIELISFSAPEGELKKYEKLYATIMASIRINPVWQAAISQFYANMQNIANKGAMDRSRIWSDAMNQIGESQYQSWQQKEESEDKIANSFSQYIRGVETYVDPNTNSTVDLSSGYKNVWSDNNGDYILSNDVLFNPNEEFKDQSWNRLKKKEE